MFESKYSSTNQNRNPPEEDHSKTFLQSGFFFRINLGSRSRLGPTHRRGHFRDPEMVKKGKKHRTRPHFGAKSGVIFRTPKFWLNQPPASPLPSKKVFESTYFFRIKTLFLQSTLFPFKSGRPGYSPRS